MLGKIIGKTTTHSFSFIVEAPAKKFQYVEFDHHSHTVLAQIIEMIKEKESTVAKCFILGYRDKGTLLNLRVPVSPDTVIREATDTIISSVLGLGDMKNSGAYIGILDGRHHLKVYLDLHRLLTKHCAVLAKSGSGKSYFCGVLLEEIMERYVPIVVIDPHGEYHSLQHPADPSERLEAFGLEPKSFMKRIRQFSPDVGNNSHCESLSLGLGNLTPQEFMHLLPGKISSSHIGMLYAALKHHEGKGDFDSIIMQLEAEEGNIKWNLIHTIQYVKNLGLFSPGKTPVNLYVRPGQCSIINLRGVPQEIQEVVVYKLVHDLFTARKHGEVPPFFLVIEEAHNYAPERSFGETKCSGILRTVLAEGRKFGLGVCVISQRSARVDKSVLSQTGTQIILKLTNPHDLKTISNSVEGITVESEREIRNLPIGTAMVVGVVDIPLFVDIRPRMTQHGGDAVNILEAFAAMTSDDTMYGKGTEREVLPVILSSLQKKPEGNVVLVPCSLLRCRQSGKEFTLLLDLTTACLYVNGKTISLMQPIGVLNDVEERIVKVAMKNGSSFTAAHVFSDSGLQFSDVYDHLQTLVKKNFFVKHDGQHFGLSESLQFYLQLQEYASFEKSEFVSVSYSHVLPKKYDVHEISTFLSNFLIIEGSSETYLMKLV